MDAQQIKLFSSDASPEWYTPAAIIDGVLDMWGTIDLDPCSDLNYNVPATTHYTIENDGLSQPWYGRVYCNPPYGREIIKWIKKIDEEYTSGNIDEAVVLAFANTDTRWFNLISKYTLCFIQGRLKFRSPVTGTNHSAMRPSMLAYLGEDNSKFVESFSRMGNIFKKVTFK